jgi:hypothetical protein
MAAGDGTSAAIELWHDVQVGAMALPRDNNGWCALRANAVASGRWQRPHVAGSAILCTALDGTALFLTPRCAAAWSEVVASPPWHFSQPTRYKACLDVTHWSTWVIADRPRARRK